MTTWLDEAEKLAKAATPGPWEALEIAGWWEVQVAPAGYDHGPDLIDDQHPRKVENAAHIATWSPDRVLLVIAALRESENVAAIVRAMLLRGDGGLLATHHMALQRWFAALEAP